MAKNGTKTTVAIIGLIISATVIGAGLIAYAVTNTHQTDDTAQDLENLKVDGCGPSKQNTTSVAVIETKLENIEKNMTQMRIEQTADTQRIIDAIEKNI